MRTSGIGWERTDLETQTKPTKRPALKRIGCKMIDWLRTDPNVSEDGRPYASVSSWFLTLMAMNIPVIGVGFLTYLVFSKKHPEKRSFAIAYMIYKFIFLSISVIIIIALLAVGTQLLDQLLEYMEML